MTKIIQTVLFCSQSVGHTLCIYRYCSYSAIHNILLIPNLDLQHMESKSHTNPLQGDSLTFLSYLMHINVKLNISLFDVLLLMLMLYIFQIRDYKEF